MSHFTRLCNNLDVLLSTYQKEIVVTENNDDNNNQGYGYLSSGRKRKHILKDGRIIKEGLSFSISKAKTIPYFYIYDQNEERLLQNLIY